MPFGSLVAASRGKSFPRSSLSTLAAKARAYYSVESSGGADATGRGNTLTDVNSPSYAAAKQGNGVVLVAASSQQLQRASTADLVAGDRSFEISLWVKLTALTDGQTICAKFGASNATREYRLYYDHSATRFQWGICRAASTTLLQAANALGAPAADTWYFICAGWDKDTGLMFISVNNGTVNSRGLSGTPNSSSTAFRIGADDDGDPLLGGTVDEVFVGDVRTPAERTTLYGGGTPPAWTGF